MCSGDATFRYALAMVQVATEVYVNVVSALSMGESSRTASNTMFMRDAAGMWTSAKLLESIFAHVAFHWHVTYSNIYREWTALNAPPKFELE